MTILGHIQACPTRFLAQKTFVTFKKRWPNKNLFLGRRACTSHCCVLLFMKRCFGARGALLQVFSGLSEDERAGLSASASILRAPVCARLAPDHCLMHRGQTPPASHQRCGSCRRLWLQMKRGHRAEPLSSRAVCAPSGGSP